MEMLFLQFGIKTGLIPKEIGKFYSDIFNKRHTSDYDDFIVYTTEEATELLSGAQAFVAEVKKLLHSWR